MKIPGVLSIAFTCLLASGAAQPKKPAASKQGGLVKLEFSNLINNHPVVLHDSTYLNPFGESYSIKKLKYYLSAVSFYTGGRAVTQKNTYWLINQAIDSSRFISIHLHENNYDSIGFLLGVDSARNNSGAQTGALDPLNDMFWTWHTGYIMEKMEGSSPQSDIVNNKFEYHIGGFEGVNNVLNYITLRFPGNQPIQVKKNDPVAISIHVDISRFWDAAYPLRITETPVCSSPGLLAKQIAANFSKLFIVSAVTNTL
jgi:hypothetical protein